MKRSILSLCVAVTALTFAGACARGDGEGDTTVADTATVRGTDTVNVPTTVPTTDTVITKTETTTDTIKGETKTDTAARRRNP